MIDTSKIQNDMDVVGSDGKHVGTVDNIGIKLTKNDSNAHDQHHYLKLEAVQSIDGNKLVLGLPAEEALSQLKAVEN
ncbi:hypothetical protein ACPOL_1862 [Acidisarcina polymorpha]|uniref:DUF2171 domain-containing protein n=1 Tax=Acidisarcina polymorpha TaxID=2211140 RepID=A0A2Z5FWR6_9BACT|nr:DUF2171 domain-containing protein [Acidisarcina polymorpha]AXC11202.1 hypothetical protein ACPOL_1862 [Acidisarcina polymorpha]